MHRVELWLGAQEFTSDALVQAALSLAELVTDSEDRDLMLKTIALATASQENWSAAIRILEQIQEPSEQVNGVAALGAALANRDQVDWAKEVLDMAFRKAQEILVRWRRPKSCTISENHSASWGSLGEQERCGALPRRRLVGVKWKSAFSRALIAPVS